MSFFILQVITRNSGYLYKEELLEKQRILFLPNLNFFNGDEFYDSYTNPEQQLNMEETNTPQLIFPWRIDFDNATATKEGHSHVHLHLGFNSNCRIPISLPVTPKLCFHFILEHFYNKAFLEHKNLFKNFFTYTDQNMFPELILHEYKKRLHINIQL